MIFASSAVALAVACGVTSFVVLRNALHARPSDAPREAMLLTVHRGESFGRIAERLSAERLVASPRVVRAYAWLRGYDRRIKVGTYRVRPDARPVDILNQLVEGDIYKVAVTIPEGYMQRQIAGTVARALQADSTQFAALFDDRNVLDRLGVQGSTLEGYLFPDTYHIPWGMKAEDIIALMVARLDEVLDDEVKSRASYIGFTLHEVLTLASIIEAETGRPEERRQVAAVYHNRLKRGMRLEADPTVAYAMGGYKGRLLYRDLDIDSPYNTYRRAGLPPGPICNPGAAAIHAALYPDTTCSALYFVAAGDGGHIFSETLNDHLIAVQRARRERGRQ